MGCRCSGAADDDANTASRAWDWFAGTGVEGAPAPAAAVADAVRACPCPCPCPCPPPPPPRAFALRELAQRVLPTTAPVLRARRCFPPLVLARRASSSSGVLRPIHLHTCTPTTTGIGDRAGRVLQRREGKGARAEERRGAGEKEGGEGRGEEEARVCGGRGGLGEKRRRRGPAAAVRAMRTVSWMHSSCLRGMWVCMAMLSPAGGGG